MKLEPGMRVRCVDAIGAKLRKGRDYAVESTAGEYVFFVGMAKRGWRSSRFKPVIRVKAPTRREPSSTERLLDAMFGKL